MLPSNQLVSSLGLVLTEILKPFGQFMSELVQQHLKPLASHFEDFSIQCQGTAFGGGKTTLACAVLAGNNKLGCFSDALELDMQMH